MKEVVSINIGQSGVQLSNAAWELFCIEHGIEADGRLKESLQDDDSTAFTTFFQEIPTGQYVPRVISFDTEPTVLDEVRTGAYRNLFHPDQLISGYEDAANNFARGHYSMGKLQIDSVMYQIRKTAECCEYLQNFFILNSYGGGTGSGFTSLLLDRLTVEYSHRFRVQVCVCTSPVLTTSVVEPYNATLTIHSSMECTDIAILTDNEAVYNICLETLDIPRPNYANLNRLTAQVFSDMTASVRFESSLSSDMDQLVTNLIPYPRIHFSIMSHAPNLSESRAKHQQLSTSEISRMVFDKNCTLVTCEPLNGKYMSCCLQYRGDVTPKDVNNAVYDMKRRSDIKFVEWCPTGFKLGINSQPPSTVPASEMAQSTRSVSLLTNTSAINQAWINLNRKFDLLFAKRAFVHWFVGEGMEEGEMNEARDDVTVLMADYEEITQDSENENREGENISIKPVNIKRSSSSEKKQNNEHITIEEKIVEEEDAENDVEVTEEEEVEESEEEGTEEDTEMLTL